MFSFLQLHQLEDLEKIRTRLRAPAPSQGAANNGPSTGKDHPEGDNAKNKSADVLASGISRQPSIDTNDGKDNGCGDGSNDNCGKMGRKDHGVNEKDGSSRSAPNSFKRVEAERKKAIFFCFLMLFLFFTWCPIFTLDSIIAFGIVPGINQHLLNLAVLLSHFNSAFNPVIYARKSEFRLVFRRWWARITCRNGRVHPEGSGVHSLSIVSRTNQCLTN